MIDAPITAGMRESLRAAIRERLRAAILTLLTRERKVLRPTEITCWLFAEDESFIGWVGPGHVSHQLKQLVAAGAVKRAWMPVSEIPTYMRGHKACVPSVRAYCVRDLTHKELNTLQDESAALCHLPRRSDETKGGE